MLSDPSLAPPSCCNRAQAFLDRKINLITGQAMKVAQAMQIKQQGLQGTVQAMNNKIMAAKQAAGGVES